MTLNLEDRKSNFIERLNKEKNNKFELFGDYKGMRTKTIFKHVVCGHTWSTLPVTLINSKEGFGCPNCQYRAKARTLEDFQEAVSKIEPTLKVASGQIYKNSYTPIKMYHTSCRNYFYARPDTLIANGSCPNCPRRVSRAKTTAKFKEDLYNVRGSEYVVVKGSEYKGANEKIKIQHKVCGTIWDVRATHILHNSGCPNCNSSKGEDIISKYLVKLGINFIREYTFCDCVNTKELPFDFAITDTTGEVKFLIEYDGIQHYKPIDYFGGETKFKKQQHNDRLKDEYCKSNGIKLLRVPYTKTDKEIKALINEIVKK